MPSLSWGNSTKRQIPPVSGKSKRSFDVRLTGGDEHKDRSHPLSAQNAPHSITAM